MTSKIVKKEATQAVALTGEDVMGMFGGYTGTDVNYRKNTYPFIKVLSDLTKQQKKFDDPENLSLKLVGKLFVQMRGLTTEDLVDQLSGTIIKEQQGSEIFDDSGKVVWQAHHPVFPARDEKGNPTGKAKELKEAYGKEPSNFVVLAIALDEPFAYKNGSVVKVALLKLIGTAYFPVYTKEIQGMKYEYLKGKELREYNFNNLGQVPVSFWHLTISSTTDKNKRGIEYYRYDLNVDVNSLEKSLGLKEAMKELASLDLVSMGYSGVTADFDTEAEKVSGTARDENALDVDEIEKGINEMNNKKETTVEERPVDDDGLPY